MSVLFHPSLGRFIDADELQQASGTDSDSYYRRHRSANRTTRREEGYIGAPGSRRYQRHLNATMSESEFDTEGEWDSDEDRPIVKFEWKQYFVSAGSEFFDRASTDAPRVNRGGPSHRRRMPKLSRRKRGEAATIEDHGSHSDHDQEDSGLEIVESKHAIARRMRAAKFGHLGKDSTVDGATTSNGESSAAELSDSSLSSSVASSSLTSSTPVSSSSSNGAATGLQRVAISERHSHPPHRRHAGQEHASTIFLQVEHSLRRSLRKIQPTDSEMVFLAELEALLISYKMGTFKDCSSIYSTFDLLPYDVTHDQDDIETEVTSDDEVLVHDGAQSRRFPHGEEPLHISFRNQYERYLAHGLIQFHQLVGKSYDSANSRNRITEVKIPRAGVLLHSAKLCPFLIKQQVHKRQ